MSKLRGDRPKVRDKAGTQVAESGGTIVVVHSLGVRRDLRGFVVKASSISVRR